MARFTKAAALTRVLVSRLPLRQPGQNDHSQQHDRSCGNVRPVDMLPLAEDETDSGTEDPGEGSPSSSSSRLS